LGFLNTELPNDIEGLRRMLLKVLDDLQTVKAENAFLKAEIARLKSENADLRSRLGMNSSNSLNIFQNLLKINLNQKVVFAT